MASGRLYFGGAIADLFFCQLPAIAELKCTQSSARIKTRTTGVNCRYSRENYNGNGQEICGILGNRERRWEGKKAAGPSVTILVGGWMVPDRAPENQRRYCPAFHFDLADSILQTNTFEHE